MRRIWLTLAMALLVASCTSSGPSTSPTTTVDYSATETDAESFSPPPVDAATDSSAPGDLAAAQVKCGVERWDVKTGTDAAAAQVNTTPVKAKIKDLTAKATQLGSSKSAPRSSDEMQAYTITATLTGYKIEGDADFHLVITDGSDHMIVEIPNPGCVSSSSPFKAGITKARTDFLAKTKYKVPSANASTPFVKSAFKVTVTGVLFYDFLHGQTGVAPNGVELHPVTAITFQ